ncbi:MAG: BTAD domain-containing putative transcriptional regulator [Ignavibacteria bacterium]
MNNILQIRIQPHKLPSRIVKRESLIDRITQNSNKGLILICAPAGYGKTSLAQDFLENTGTEYSWLNAHSEMNNFYIFMDYLIHSIEKIKPGFGKASLLLIEDYRDRFQLSKSLERIIDDITGTFLNELCQVLEKELFVVIDDLGNIENSKWLKLTFEKLLEKIPPNLHFIITTRTIPEFSTSILQAKRNILKIEARDLSFKAGETKQLIEVLYGIESTDDEIKILSDNLGGWITGIHLILQSHGSNFPNLRLDKIVILDDIFNYFTEDIFNSLKPEVRDFLLYTSILESFTPELCDNLMKTEESNSIIDELLSKNIFIQVNQPGDNEDPQTYSYQVLFKKFLNTKLKESKTETEINGFLKIVSGYYTLRNEYFFAVNYSLLAGDYSQAIKLIHNNFQKYFDIGNFEILWKWLETLGNERIEKDYKLLYFKSLLLKFYLGSIEESLPYIDKAMELCLSSNNTAFYIKCSISKSRNLISLGKISEAIINLNKTSDLEADKESRAKLLYLTSYAHYQNADYDNSIEMLDKATGMLEDDFDTAGTVMELRMEIYNLYGHIFLIRGDYSKSISYYERVVKKTDKLIGRYETLCNLILLYSQSGKFDKAILYQQEAKDISDRISIPIFRITYLLAYQALKFEFGDYEESIRLLEEMNEIALELNHKYYIFLSYSLIGDSFYSLNKLSKAEEYYDLAFKYLNDNNKLEKMQYSVSKALLLKKAEPIAAIEPVLMEAYEYYKEKKITYSKIQISFHLADYYRRVDNLRFSLHFLKEALEVSEEKEYTAFLQRELYDFRPLFDFALANNIQKEFIKSLNSSFLEKNDTAWISLECRKRLLEIYGSFYDIRVNLFGKSDVRIRGRLVEDAEWSKKKWKFIFIYLMLAVKKELTKDRIIDTFYPDTPIDSADNIFHQIISKFRNLGKMSYDNKLEVELSKKDIKPAKGKTSKKPAGEPKTIPSLVNYEDKILKINEDFRFNIDSEELVKIYRLLPIESSHVKKVHLQKQAIELYKGDFMEGSYDTWCEELRTKYKSYFVSISEELIKILFMEEDHNGVLHYSENLLRFDKLNLVAYEYMIGSLIKLNKPQLAKERYTQLNRYYKNEYGENPPGNLKSKIESIIN